MNNIIDYINEKLIITTNITNKEKRQIQKAIYKELQKNNTTGKFYKDEHWAGVDAVKKDIMNALHGLYSKTKHDYECSIYPERGGYRKSDDGMSQWKEYIVDIMIAGPNNTPFMSGILNCHAAGTVEDPFSMYDMSFMLSI
jgi:hypothetical protein